MKKFKAFTLLEVVLSLFLVALLGVFAFYILQGLSQGTRDLTNRSGLQQELLFFNTAVRADMDHASALRIGDDGSLECATGSMVTRYRTSPSGIQRIQSEGDTVNFVLPVQQSEVRLISDAIPLVYLWHITLANGEGTSSTSFTKTYAPADRVRERLNHVDQDPHRP
ncbi:MAG: type II secretion system protein [Flavobacteriales bacterium]|nr:type II secretion system protein [Flavobacteriales bacterium]